MSQVIFVQNILIAPPLGIQQNYIRSWHVFVSSVELPGWESQESLSDQSSGSSYSRFCEF